MPARSIRSPSGSTPAFPRNRRTDLGLIVLFIGAATEVLQSLVGRDGNFPDFAADATGILVAMLPATVERARLSIRRSKRDGPRRQLMSRPTR